MVSRRAVSFLGRLFGRKVQITPPSIQLSYGEAKRRAGCRCRPSNVLYWELSDAVTDDCPIHSNDPLGACRG